MYDDAHVIMIKNYLKVFDSPHIKYETEVPFNYYGTRGFVDLVEYPANPLAPLDIHEFETQILCLNELIRDVKSRFEYFPQYLVKAKGLPQPASVRLFLILLNTKRNIEIVSENYRIFKAVLSDISNNNPPQKVCLAFYDPVRMVHFRKLIRVGDDKTDYRTLGFYPIDISRTSKPTMLKILIPSYINGQDLIRRYKEYIEKYGE